MLPGGCSGDANSKDLAALNGKWAVVAAESYGKVVTPEEMKGQRWSITGNIITVTVPGMGDHKMAFKLHAEKTPREMEILPQYAPYEGETSRVFYTLESGKLRVCNADADQKSAGPAEFSEAMVFEKIVR
jgi:uncharacterized protein (TIGR03067 family)